MHPAAFYTTSHVEVFFAFGVEQNYGNVIRKISNVKTIKLRNDHQINRR